MASPKTTDRTAARSSWGKWERGDFDYMGVSKTNGTPKSSILIGFSIRNHPFWGTTIFGNIHILLLFVGRVVEKESDIDNFWEELHAKLNV